MAALLPLLRRAGRAEVPVSDAELLDRFGRAREESAFTELVRRHGPVVYRVCRRLVGSAGADDAFQATFLVLATRLSSARASGALGGWLAGVAGRVARQMRRGTGRRARHESAAASSRPTEGEDRSVDLADQFRVLDEELTRLPDALRGPVVLCLLQGYTQEQAAVELGRDARTLRRRLERAKGVLRSRLERRGVVPAVAAALVAGMGEVAAVVPHELSSCTVALVFDFLTGGTALASPPVALAKGLAMTMFARKLVLGAVAATLGLVGLGAVMADGGPPAPEPAPTAPAPTDSTPPPAKAPVAPAPPVMGASEFDWARDEELAKKTVTALKRDPKAEPSVLIQAVCVRVPVGFCDRVGLTNEDAKGTKVVGPTTATWVLTPRETRMLNALLRAEPNREVLSRPQMLVGDGKPGYFQVGQKLDVVTEVEAVTKDQSTTYTAKTVPVEVGLKLRVAPVLAPNGFVKLGIETVHTALAGGDVKVGGVPAPVINEQSINSTVVLPDSGTFVLRSVVRGTAPQKVVTTGTGFPFPLTEIREKNPPHEMLWVLTTHVVRAPEKGKGPQPAPVPPASAVPVVPPAPAPTAPPALTPEPLPARP